MTKMVSLRAEIILLILLAAVLCSKTAAQSSCTATFVNLSPCLSYITANTDTPASECCRRLEGVVQSQPKCLCDALRLRGTSVSAALNINETLAMGLPTACNLRTPPSSSCNTAASPTYSPAAAPESPRAIPFLPGPIDDNSAAAGSLKSSLSMLYIFVFAASCASTFSIQ